MSYYTNFWEYTHGVFATITCLLFPNNLQAHDIKWFLVASKYPAYSPYWLVLSKRRARIQSTKSACGRDLAGAGTDELGAAAFAAELVQIALADPHEGAASFTVMNSSSRP